MTGLLVLVAVVLMFGGFVVYLRSERRRRATGLPTGEIIYLDTGDWRRNDSPIFSTRYQLAGKPDYLIDSGGEIIPVEVKSTHLHGDVPYESHLLQLAAYCLLVEDTSPSRPSYGILKYANKTIRVPYSRALREQLIDTMEAMRQSVNSKNVDRSHEESGRCHACGYHHACGRQALLKTNN